MILAQPVNPHGLSPSFAHGLGQFVVHPVGACRDAILSGTMGDVRLLMLGAALIYHEIDLALLSTGAPKAVRAIFTQRRQQAEAAAAEAGKVASNLPAKVPLGDRVDQFCAVIQLAQTDAIQFSTQSGVKAALDKLFVAAQEIQSRIEATTRPVPAEPEPDKPKGRSIVVPAMLTGALVAVLGLSYYFYRRSR